MMRIPGADSFTDVDRVNDPPRPLEHENGWMMSVIGHSIFQITRNEFLATGSGVRACKYPESSSFSSSFVREHQ